MFGKNKKEESDPYSFDSISSEADYQEVEADNSRWELDNQEVLSNYEHSLRGERKNNKGEWYQPESVRPKMNDAGIFDTISDLQTIMHKGTYLGNIPLQYSLEETKSEAKAYMKKLKLNMINWDVDRSQFRILVLGYARQVFMALTRPVNDKERMHRNKRLQFQEHYKHDEVKPSEITL